MLLIANVGIWIGLGLFIVKTKYISIPKACSQLEYSADMHTLKRPALYDLKMSEYPLNCNPAVELIFLERKPCNVI